MVNRKISSADVARRAEVSQATVSYVLNRRAGQTIREETRQRVFDAAEALGYRPNLAARSLATGKTHTVALWVPFSYRSVFSNVIEQVMKFAWDSRMHVVVMQTSAETADTLGTGGFVNIASVDGILAFDCSGLINDILDRYPRIGPIVSFGPAYTDRTDHVGVDLRGGAAQAVRHLLDAGCRRVAYAGFRDAMFAGEPRYDAYVEAMRESGLPSEIIALERGEYDDARTGVKAYVEANGHPEGLFCWNDETAIGANRGLADLGVRVPEDVAIIGSDGIRETAYCVPTISTVSQPFHETCRLAWDFLQRRLADPTLPVQSAVLPMHLEKRDSTIRL